MPKDKSLETKIAVQEADIEYIKSALVRVEKSLELLQDKFLTKQEYYERGKIIEHIENDCRKMIKDTETEIKRIDVELDDVDTGLKQVKWWIKGVAFIFGLLWPILMMVIGVWINKYL